MRNGKQVLVAAAVAAGMLVAGATPRPAAAEGAAAVVRIADGTYPVVDRTGKVIGYIIIRNGTVVGSEPA